MKSSDRFCLLFAAIMNNGRLRVSQCVWSEEIRCFRRSYKLRTSMTRLPLFVHTRRQSIRNKLFQFSEQKPKRDGATRT